MDNYNSSSNIGMNLYRSFYVLAKSKSYAEASEKLCISAPAVCKNIKQLENLLETPLFYKENDGTKLTPDGKEYLKYIEQGLKMFDLGEKIIFLDELLQIVKDNKLFVNLELKNNYVFYEGLEEAVMNMVNEFGLKDDVILSSFNHESMELCKKIDPSFKTGLLFESPLMNTVEYMRGIKHEAVHPGYYMLLQKPSWVSEFKKMGLEINTWTVNDENYMRYLIEMGVDAIIGNFPDLTSKVLNNL